jgi:hypothetical protein
MLEHEKAIATEEIRQEWMRRLRPMPHRQNGTIHIYDKQDSSLVIEGSFPWNIVSPADTV